MEEEMVLKFAKGLSEVKYHQEKLLELERGVNIQADEMRCMGLTWDMVAPKIGEVLLTLKPGIREGQSSAPVVEIRRCKWWNRGFCREKERCIYSAVLSKTGVRRLGTAQKEPPILTFFCRMEGF